MFQLVRKCSRPLFRGLQAYAQVRSCYQFSVANAAAGTNASTLTKTAPASVKMPIFEGMRLTINGSELTPTDKLFNQDSQLRISNPEIIQSRKALRDVFVEKKTTAKQLCKLFQADTELFKRSLKCLGINDADDTTISFEEAEVLAYEYEFKAILQGSQKNQQTELRPPVVTIMGHVDHGKTTLLDSLRNSRIVDTEFGGITQKIGAFHTITAEGKRITFIDTPGHEAFVNMRVRGASSTDLIILVVSAVDGIQPQTLEVINIAHQAKVPLIVAINKIDVPGSNPEELEKELFQKGKLNLESQGGNIPVIHISAKFNKNIDLLEELILFETELMELKENGQAEGMVLESRRTGDNEAKSCTVVVHKGTLKIGDYLILGDNYCKVRQMRDDRNTNLQEAYPSYAVELVGLKELPQAGDPIFVVENETKAKLITQRRKWQKEQKKEKQSQIIGAASKIKFANSYEKRKFHSGNKDYIKQKYAQVEAKILGMIQEFEGKEDQESQNQLKKLKLDLLNHQQYMSNMVQEINSNAEGINLIIKAPDYGTKETLIAQVYKIVANYPEVNFNLVNSGVGQITESDIRDASLFNATILSMDVTASLEAAKLAKQEDICIKHHRIIYSLIDEVKGMLNSKVNQDKVNYVQRGQGMVKNVFRIKGLKNAQKVVAGVNVTKGKFNKNFTYKIIRNGQVVGEEIEIANLKHFKQEVNEIKKGDECGIVFFEFQDYQPGDVIEAYEVEQPQQKSEQAEK